MPASFGFGVLDHSAMHRLTLVSNVWGPVPSQPAALFERGLYPRNSFTCSSSAFNVDSSPHLASSDHRTCNCYTYPSSWRSPVMVYRSYTLVTAPYTGTWVSDASSQPPVSIGSGLNTAMDAQKLNKSDDEMQRVSVKRVLKQQTLPMPALQDLPLVHNYSPGACAHCKSLKIRCDFIPEESICVRCKAGNFKCISRGRKKRKLAPTHEDLQERSRSQDLQIQSLLRQLDQIKTNAKVQQWRWRAGTGVVADRQNFDGTTDNFSPEHPDCILVDDTRLASAFISGDSVHMQDDTTFSRTISVVPQNNPSYPHIIQCGLVHPDEVLGLFNLFFDAINPCLAILDPVMHTPQKVMLASPFLFTIICALASRHCSRKPQLRHLAMEIATYAAVEALRNERSITIESCQAYLLLSVYPMPRKRWADDRRWLLTGIALRLAQDLKLDQPAPPEYDERERLNRTRTWLNAVCLDRLHASQLGKPPMAKLDDYVVRTVRAWYNPSSMSLPFDIHTCGYAEIHLLMAEFWQTVRETNARDSSAILRTVDQYDGRISRLISFWIHEYRQDPHFVTNRYCVYRTDAWEMVGTCLRLAILSTGVQHVAQQGGLCEYPPLNTSIQVAQTALRIMIERLYPVNVLRFAMEAHFLYVAFAAAFLLNLLQQQPCPNLTRAQEVTIVTDIERLIKILASKDVALDNQHFPALVSAFLSSLLRKQDLAPRLSGGSNFKNGDFSDGQGKISHLRPIRANVVGLTQGMLQW
ncbi:hypothetical protein AcV7_008909 [Taiwanofungus camphoratus]|nr:hypothetical protein AcV7_008909 [Antrodia cinnamomea]